MYSQAYIDYLIYFHAHRDYFECHEVLEEHWKDTGMNNRMWVAFIQLAVALYHQRRGNFRGATKMLTQSLETFKQHVNQIKSYGLDAEKLLQLLEDRLEQIHEEKPYESLNLPIIDKQLLNTCQQECAKQQLTWGCVSDLSNHYLLHKHRERDRSDVIAEREKQKQMKQQQSRND